MSVEKQTPKEFALAQLAPYYKNPKTCGFNESNDTCEYLSKSGNMCVAGKNLLPKVLEKYKNSDRGIIYIINQEGGEKKALKPESVGILEIGQWQRLQCIHDDIAKFGIDSLNMSIHNLGLFTYDELKEYAEKL